MPKSWKIQVIVISVGLLFTAALAGADEAEKAKSKDKETPKQETVKKESKHGKISESKEPTRILPKEESEEPAVETSKEEKTEKKESVAEKPQKPHKPRGEWDLPIRLDEDVEISKIYTFWNDPDKIKTSKNQALNYEEKYFNYGAVTKAQKKEKMGQYYVVSWDNDGDVNNLILRFDYRQEKTKDLVHTLEIPYKQVDGFHKATFSITGDAYEKFGPVKSWRVSVVRNGVIVAKEQSFIW